MDIYYLPIDLFIFVEEKDHGVNNLCFWKLRDSL